MGLEFGVINIDRPRNNSKKGESSLDRHIVRILMKHPVAVLD